MTSIFIVASAASDSAYIGPTAALIGALLVAIIAAVTANRRLTKQLAAEHARHAAELNHDRELADLSDLRALFDEAALALSDVERAYAHMIPPADEVPIDERARCQRLLDVLAARLHVRLGNTDAIATAFAEAHSAAHKLAAASKAPGQDYDRYVSAGQALALALDDFLTAAAQRVGTLRLGV